MKAIIVTGSREWSDSEVVRDVLRDCGQDELCTEMLLIHGGALGVDHIAHKYARDSGWDVLELIAQWRIHGKAAGPIRNAQMVRIGCALRVCGWDVEVHAFPGPQSRGTWDMVRQCREVALEVEVHGPWAEAKTGQGHKEAEIVITEHGADFARKPKMGRE